MLIPPFPASSRPSFAAALPPLAVAWACCLGGCASDEITIVVCGDLSVPGDVDAIRVELLDDELVRVREGVLQLVPGPGEGGDVLSLPVSPSLDATSGRGWVRVIGLLDQVPVAQFDRQIFEFDDFDEVDAFLGRACLRSFCMAGQTCIAGSCVQAPTGNAAPRCGGS